VRLFVAMEVPEAVRREVARRVASVRDRLPQARWVDPEMVHLTMVFLGEVPEAHLPGLSGLSGALRQAFAPYPPLPMRLSGAGTFPPGRPARVAWLGLDAPDGLISLQADVVRAAVAAVEHEPEDRPYRAHVTLARCQSPWRRDAIDKFIAAFPGETGQPWVADRGVLMESKLSPKGARYRVVEAFPLEGAPERATDE
jgi:2'-5' RNA ligase